MWMPFTPPFTTPTSSSLLCTIRPPSPTPPSPIGSLARVDGTSPADSPWHAAALRELPPVAARPSEAQPHSKTATTKWPMHQNRARTPPKKKRTMLNQPHPRAMKRRKQPQSAPHRQSWLSFHARSVSADLPRTGRRTGMPSKTTTPRKAALPSSASEDGLLALAEDDPRKAACRRLHALPSTRRELSWTL